MIVGLGNPGRDYVRTRHNAGFMALDKLADRHAPGAPVRQRFHSSTLDINIPGAGKCMLMKPLTFMNRSGLAVAEAVNFFKLEPAEDLLVIVDEVAIDLGTIRLRATGSAGGHNGLADIERVLTTPDYARCRVGIGPQGMGTRHDFVLARFSEDQIPVIEAGVSKAADAAECWATSGITTAMNTFNTRPPKADTPKLKQEPNHTAEQGEAPRRDTPEVQDNE